MSYQALYRKYRPATFGQIIGQEHITRTLQNQIKTAKTAHAYLFCGSRGTGKTSTAKIFAKALNCQDNSMGEPCGQCVNCLGSEEGVDVIEIDAASNNGVDEIRDLKDKVRFLPVHGKFKVYIIDEVHMLSVGAFNALLKTLEEPPAHVVFILATTEPQKLPATILSRCQRYEFHRISVDDIVSQMRYVLADIGAQVDEEGLHSIARASEGGMRDALSILDQCIAYCGSSVSGEQVLNVLGSMDQAFIFAMVSQLMDKDAKNVLLGLDHVLALGRDLGVFCRELVNHIRVLALIRVCGDARALVDCSEATYKKYDEQAARYSVEKYLRAISLLSKAEADMKWLSFARTQFECALVAITRPEDEVDLSSLSERISELECKLSGGAFTVTASNQASVPPTGSAASVPDVPGLPFDEELPPWEEAPPPSTAADAAPVLKQKEPLPPQTNVGPGTTASKDGAKAAFEYMIEKSSAAMQALFRKNNWQYRLSDAVLELYAPSELPPVLVNSLKLKADEVADAMSDKYPGITLKYLTGLPVKSQVVTLTDKAIDLFGADKLSVINEKD